MQASFFWYQTKIKIINISFESAEILLSRLFLYKNIIKYFEIDISKYDFPYLEKLGTIGMENYFAEFQKIEKNTKEEFDKAGTRDAFYLCSETK